MTILYIDGVDAAHALGTANQERVVEFQPGVVLSDQDVGNIALVAQTRENASTIGGHTPERLADDFATMISSRGRSILQHIYLLAGEAGMLKNGELSLAQRFVNAMATHGFNHLQVHAVASPGVPMCGMGIDIVTDKKFSPNRSPAGYVNVFYYKNEYGHSVDLAIVDARDALELSQKEVATFQVIAKLSRGQQVEKRAAEKRVREHKELYVRLILKRKIDARYQASKAGILSTTNYKNAMLELCNTFTAQATEPVMSPAVSYAIYYLSSQKKHSDFVHNDLLDLRANPSWVANEVILALQAHNNKRGSEGRYYTAIAQPLEQMLGQQDFSMLQVAAPASRVSVDGAALQAHGFFGLGQVPSDKLTIEQKLERYKAQREAEWWGFHYNFLGLMSVVYYISDSLCGTDYFNSKHREIKTSATNKLLNGEEISAFTRYELSALREGRLGKIVAEYGGLEAVITALKPAQDDDLLAVFAAPDCDPLAL